MICEKCGTEFSEGRNCPNCNALAIFVKEDEYKNRKQEWEEDNAPKEEVQKKIQLNIHVNPVIVKRVLMIAAVVCVVATAAVWITGRVRSAMYQEQFRVVYGNGAVMDSEEGSFEAYPAENAIFSTEGNFVYPDTFDKSGIEGEITAEFVSPRGTCAAFVSKEGVEEENVRYFLYISDPNGCRLIRSGSNPYNIVDVTSGGGIYYEEMELGPYEVVVSTNIYLYNGERVLLLVEDITRSVPCENENEFIYYDKDMQPYLYSNGSGTSLLEDGNGYEFVCTSTGKIYYRTPDGDLYEQGKVGSVDRNIQAGTLRAAANSDKVIYARAGSLYGAGGSFNAPVMLLSSYDIYNGRCNAVEKSGKLYYAYDGMLYTCDKSGGKISSKEGFPEVYLSFK
ncbi:MAG: hypothetical protein NC086_05240 [Alistipes sp.]|nr:hypothetical protein [Alistipes sp.]